jgi:hypothetical protein
MDGGLRTGLLRVKTYKWVYLKVSEVEVNINSIEADEKVNEGFTLGRGDILEESGGDGFTRGEGCANRKRKNESFGIDIADIDTSFMSEEDRITFASRIDADIVFGMWRMG